MKDSADATLVTEITRGILSEIAPEEMPVFAAASRTYLADPKAALRQLESKDNVLGFGVEDVAGMVTPAALLATSETLDFLMHVAKKGVEDGLTGEISQIVKAMFARFRSSRDAPSPLTREHIDLIHRNVLAAARRQHLPTDKAQSLANAVTAQLVLSKE
jgi:hypothetical protein